VPDRAALVARLDDLAARMRRATERVVAERRQAHDEVLLRLERAGTQRLSRLRARVVALRERLHAQHPHARLGRQRLAHARLEARLVEAIRRRLARAHQRLELAARALTMLSPTASLARGYAIVMKDDGAVVRGAADVVAGDRLDITTGAGHINARVEDTTP
jgi:exodeoxyribonuclease VII large subunit